MKSMSAFINILRSKQSILPSKTECIEMIHSLSRSHSKEMAVRLLRRDDRIDKGRMDKGNGDDEESTLLHHITESLFCASRLDLYEVSSCGDGDDENGEALYLYSNIVMHQMAISKLMTTLVCQSERGSELHRKVTSYSFNFKRESFKLRDDQRIQTKLHQLKQPFFHCVVQLLLFEDSTSNDHETEALCLQFKNHDVAQKYGHLLQRLKGNLNEVIDYVKRYCLSLEKHAETLKVDEINRRYRNGGGGGGSSAEKDSKEDRLKEFVVEEEDLVKPEIKEFIEIFLENMEEDQYMMMTVSPHHTQYAVLQQQRALLIAILLRLMQYLTEFMDRNQVKQSVRGIEFEIMSLLKRFKSRGDEVARRLHDEMMNRIKVLEHKYDDHRL